ncbi:MAG: hypothetical protein ACRDI2_04735 [Chloroflexota bacterium]
MPDRHRGNTRDFDRNRGRGFQGGGRGFGGPPRRDRRGPVEPRPSRGFDFEGPPPIRERRPPAPPAEMEEFEDVDAQLAVAILGAATKLTEIVGTTGLPEGYTERREAVLESFEAIYFALLDAITGGEDEEEGSEE